MRWLRKRFARRRKVRVGLVAILITVCVLLGGGIHLLHGYQVRRNAAAFLKHADKAEREGDRAKAADYLRRYIALHPEDIEQRARLELIRADLAETPRQKLQATFRLAAVLRKAPQRLDVRRRLAELQLEIGRFTDALEQLNAILRASGDDPELYEMLARAHLGRGDYAAAEQSYRRAIELAPKRIDLYVALASLLRDRLEQNEAASKVIEELKKNVPNKARSFVEAARHYLAIQEKDQAWTDAQKAVELAPEDADALTVAARVALARDEHDTAVKFLERAVAAAPTEPDVYTLAAQAQLQQGQYDAAIETLREGLTKTEHSPELVLMLAELLATRDQLDEAKKLVASLEADNIHPGYRYLVRGVIALQEDRVLEAADLFERAIAELFALPEYQARALYYAASAYQRMGLLDLAVTRLRTAISSRPRAAHLRWMAASVLASLGQFEDALADAEVAIRYSTPEPEQAALYLRLHMLTQLQLPEPQRDWRVCDQLADNLRKQYGDKPVFLVTYADYLWVRGRGNEALPLLEQGLKVHPDAVELYVALATHFLRWKLPAKAEETLDRARQQVGDVVSLRLARLLMLPEDAEEAAKVLDGLIKDIDHFEPAEQARLLRAVALTWARLRKADRARELLQQAAALVPYDLGTRVLLFDFTLQARDTEGLRKLVQEIRTIEARDPQRREGAVWRYAQAALIMLEAGDKPDAETIARARQLLEEARAQRPNWARLHAQLGALYLLEDRVDDAAEAYLSAVQLGDRSPRTVGLAVQALLRANRVADADRMLRRLYAEKTLPPEVGLTASAVVARMRDFNLALELAQEHLERNPDDAAAHVWYARLLEAQGKPQEAEKHYRKACELSPEMPQVWTSLVGFYARNDQLDRAREVIEKEVRTHLKGEVLAACLSACYELVGDNEAAEKAWSDLRAKRPEDPAVLVAVAEFYIRRGDLEEAEKQLRAALKHAPEDNQQFAQAVRRRLATVLLARGGYARWQEAHELIEKNLSEVPDSRADLRVKAMLLATRNSARLQREALALFEQLLESGDISPDERFLLARLYYRYGQPQKGRDQMLRLLTERPDNARYIAGYVRILLNRDQLQDAALWVQKLEELEPDSYRTVELKALTLHALDQTDDAVAAVKRLEQRYLKGQDGQPNTVGLALVGRLYERLGRPEEAGRMYRAVAQQVPEGLLLLAQWLADQDQVEEAMRVLEECWEKLPAERAALGVIRLARHPNVRPEHRSAMRRRLEAALQKNPKSIQLRVAMALMYDAEGEYKVAAQAYQEILLVDPSNVVALNNLAWLLSECFDRAEDAQELIDRAIAQLGPAPELLDTKAVVLYRLGKIEGEGAALELLEEAYETAPAPHIGFHLARVYADLGRDAEARELLAELGDVETVKRDLHGSEVDDYLKLLARLKVEVDEQPSRR